MAGSGMCTGGRVRHHLQHNIGREDSSIVFVGYAANGTLARRIIDGAELVNIFGENIPVRARIYTINGFSAHADQAELLAWQSRRARSARSLFTAKTISCGSSRHILPTLASKCRRRIKLLSCERTLLQFCTLRHGNPFEKLGAYEVETTGSRWRQEILLKRAAHRVPPGIAELWRRMLQTEMES